MGAAEAIVSANADPGSIVLDADLVVRVGTGFLTTQDQLDRINALLEKVATVIGDVTILNSPPEAVTAGVTADGLASAVGTMTLTGDDAVGLAGLVSVGGSLLMETTADPSFAALTSVGGNFERTSGGAPTVGALATVGGDLNAQHTGDWDYSQVTFVGGDAVVPANATSINLAGVSVAGGIANPGGLAGQLNQTASTTGAINLGTADVDFILADSASSIVGDVTTLASLTINAAAATSIRFDGATTATGTINITATGTTIISFGALTQSENIYISASAEAHFGALVDADEIIITATDAADFGDLLDLDAFTSITGATIDLGSLGSASNTLDLLDAPSVNFPNFVATNTVYAPSTTSLALKSINNVSSNLFADAATSLTLSSQNEAFNLTDTHRNDFLPSLTTLSITGSGTAQEGLTTVDVDVTAAATLTTITLNGKLNRATISGAGITSLSTGGYITDLVVSTTGVSSLDLDHSYIGSDTAPTIDIRFNSNLTSVDMAGVEKVQSVVISSNASVTSIVAPAAVYPEALATIGLTVLGADITGTWTEGVTGTLATQTVPALAHVSSTFEVSSEIEALLDWYEAAAAASNNSPTIDIAFSDISFVERTRAADGFVTETATTTTYPSFGAALAADQWASVRYTTGLGTTSLDNAQDLSIVVRD